MKESSSTLDWKGKDKWRETVKASETANDAPALFAQETPVPSLPAWLTDDS